MGGVVGALRLHLENFGLGQGEIKLEKKDSNNSENPGAHPAHALPDAGIGMDWVMVVLSAGFCGGFFLDGWAHAHGRADETFFTPWHAALYSGFLAITTYLTVVLVTNRIKGHPWLRSLPAGYGISLLGALLWFPGGLGDEIWHEVFGIEANAEALLSPTHLILALGAILMVSGPLRRGWGRLEENEQGWPRQIPMLFSVTYTLSLLTFMNQLAHPLANKWGSEVYKSALGQEMGVVSILLDTGLLLGMILFLVRRFSLAPGALTLVFALNAVAMGFLYDQGPYPLGLVIARAAAGVAADLLLYLLNPSVQQVGRFRSFSFTVPLIIYLFYFFALQVTGGIYWSVHMWTGVTVLAGFVGLLISFLVVPPLKSGT